MTVAIGMLCISKSPQLHFSKLNNGESSCAGKLGLRWKCFTADVRDGNEALMHVKDRHVKDNNKKKKSPQIVLWEGLYIPATSITYSYLAAYRSLSVSLCLTHSSFLCLSPQTLYHLTSHCSQRCTEAADSRPAAEPELVQFCVSSIKEEFCRPHNSLFIYLFYQSIDQTQWTVCTFADVYMLYPKVNIIFVFLFFHQYRRQWFIMWYSIKSVGSVIIVWWYY